MLTSKEIIERTGISRATLNNYIGTGLVPRPQVLPPGPEHGAAPRIGYFPDDTVRRVETIQRLKREGWSISRIAELFAQQPPDGAPLVQAPATVQAPPAPVRGDGDAADGDAWPLSLRATSHPAYLVDDSLAIAWGNEAARTHRLSPLAGHPLSGSVLAPLFAADDPAREALLRFHLQLAGSRGAIAADLMRGLPAAQAAVLDTLYRATPMPPQGLVAQARIPAAGPVPARTAYAVQFQQGILFAYAPAAGEAREAAEPARNPGAQAAPAISPMVILFTTLQDAAGLWVRLAAHEYFELVNEVWAELDPIFRRHGGRHGRHPDEGLACYFLPQRDGSSYLWNALAAAHQARAAMRQVSLRWQARKGWDLELCMNTGLEEGQDWLGAIGTGARADLRVLGDAADRAEQLSRCSRGGAVLVTRRLLGRLPADDRRQVVYGVPRFGADAEAAEERLLYSFARLRDIAASPLPGRVADLAVAELIALSLPADPADRGAG